MIQRDQSGQGRLAVIPIPIADRLPPQNLEAEKGVIGAIILDNDVLHDIIPILKAEHFYRDRHQIIYAAIVALYALGTPIDTIILEEEIRRAGHLEKIGGVEALWEIVSAVPHAANARYHAEFVRERATARDLILAANEILRDGYSDNFTAADLLDSAGRAVQAIEDAQADHDSGIATAQMAALEALDLARRRHLGEAAGIDTGLDALDRALGDMLPGRYYVFAARPSHGKSALALQVAERCVALRKQPAFFASLEMGRAGLGQRLLSMRSGVGGGYFSHPQTITPEILLRLEEAAAGMGDLTGLLIDETAGVTVPAIASVARRHKARSGGLGLIVVDYLQLIEPADSREGREVQVAGITRGLRDLAKRLDCVVLVLSQLNRKIEERKDAKPMMSDLRESGQIEQDADGIVFIYRPSVYDRNDRPGVAELHIAKNRAGEPGGVIEVGWNGPLTMFENMTDPVPDFDRGAIY